MKTLDFWDGVICENSREIIQNTWIYYIQMWILLDLLEIYGNLLCDVI